MSKTKFTPGPWHHDHNPHNPYYTCLGDDEYGTVMQECHYLANGSNFIADIVITKSERGRANADLIAAAPELYEGSMDDAEKFEAVAGELAGEHRGTSNLVSILLEQSKRIRERLKKARGE